MTYRKNSSAEEAILEKETTAKTTAETTAEGRSSGQVRCMNCMKRIAPPPGSKQYKCPHCGFEWRITWLWPDFPRIRGPVWDVNRRLTVEATAKTKIKTETRKREK
jgi:hypothetical protein